MDLDCESVKLPRGSWFGSLHHHTPHCSTTPPSQLNRKRFCFWHLLRWCIHGWGANLGFCFRAASRLRDGERQEELPRLYFASNWYSARPGGDGAAELAVLDSGPSGGWRGLWDQRPSLPYIASPH